MTDLPMTLACWDHDRVQPLIDGRVHPAGIDLRSLDTIVEETSFRMARFAEFDASEMSMSSYMNDMFAPETYQEFVI